MNCFSYKLCCGLLLTWVAFCLPVPEVMGQSQSSFDPLVYFDRLDRNRDGALTQEELNPRAAKFLLRLGVDPREDRIRLKLIRKLLAKQQGSAEKQSAADQQRLSGGLRVPAFGVPAEDETVPNFGGYAAKGDAIEYSDSTLQMTAQVLTRYDKNKDGFIDQSELKRARWGRPEPMESDLNGDGRLSRNELMQRYHVRQQEQARRRVEPGERRRGQDGGDSAGSSERRVKNSREFGGRKPTSSTDSRSSNKDRSAYVKYSKSLIQRYDKDSDGRLNKAEWKSVRRPPAKADRNGDGYVDQDEYAAALIHAAEAKPERGRSDVKSEQSAIAKARSTGKANPPRGDMTKLDTNGDSQVQMHEFASDWDKKKRDEFYAIDKNGDGVITAAEWAQ